MKIFKRTLIAMAMLAVAGSVSAQQSETDYAALVNPKIGSGGHGHVFVEKASQVRNC